MIDNDVDILIIGGGLTGASLLLALKNSGHSCVLVEAAPFSDKIQSDFDARSLALSPATARILKMLGVWPLLSDHASAIESIHVSDQHRFGATRLKGELNKALGHVIEMQYINHALHQLLPKENILAPAKLVHLDSQQGIATLKQGDKELQIKAQLIVAADGADSAVRRLMGLTAKSKDYQQSAIVANIELEKPHQHRAFERFTPSGPLALLPMTDQRMSLVWAMPPAQASEHLALSDKDFLKALQNAFGYRLGRFIKSGQRQCFPLKQTLMPTAIKWPVVFVGNAAHTLHPVAGQGFNLGLRDVAMLAQLIKEKGVNPDMLKIYQEQRKGDQNNTTRMTDQLLSIFTSRFMPLKLARSLGLIAVDNSSSLKKLLTHYASGFGGIVSDLICEIPLDKGLNSGLKEHP